MLKLFGQLGGRSRRDVAVAFTTLSAMLAAHAMLETARDALFLAELPPSRLPLAYLAVAASIALTTRLNTAACRRLDPTLVLSITLVSGALITAGFWLWTDSRSIGSLFALYVWPGLLTTTALVQFWLRLHHALDVERAKRLYAAIGAGGLLGAFVGSAAASALVELVRPRALLLAAGLLYAAAGLLPLTLLRREIVSRRPPRRASPDRERVAIFSDAYATKLVALMLVMALATTVVDYLFKSQVVRVFETSELAPFFARFYAAVNISALVAQLVLLPWLLRVANVHRAVMVLPLLLLLGGLGAWVLPAFLVCVVLKGADGVLRHSLFGTASEIFYLPLPGALRERLKGLVAAIGQRGGQTLGSLAILAVGYAGAGDAVLLAGVVLSTSVAIGLILSLRRAYADRFHAELRERALDASAEAPPLEIESLESLLAALSSPSEAEVLAAIELLHMYDKDRLVPPLILHHPSEAVVLRALDLYAGARRSEVERLLEHLLVRPEPAIRAAALRAACAYGPECTRRALGALAKDDDPGVRITKVAATLTTLEATTQRGRRQLDRLLAAQGEERLALARSVTLLPLGMQASIALALYERGGEDVRVALVQALAQAPRMHHFEVLLRMLMSSSTRELARRALMKLPTAAVLARLEEAFDDRGQKPAIRLHLPRTISRFHNERAARFLSSRLPRERDERVAFKILRGLGRMRAQRHRLPIDREAVHEAALAGVEAGLFVLRARLLMERAIDGRQQLQTPGARLLLAMLDERFERLLERVFRMMHILMPSADFWIIHASCFDDDHRVRAASRELLRHTLPQPLRGPMLVMLTELPSTAQLRELAPDRGGALERLERALETGAGLHAAYRGLLEQLGDHRDAVIGQVATSHAAELRTLSLEQRRPAPAVGVLEDVARRLSLRLAARRRSRVSLTEALL